MDPRHCHHVLATRHSPCRPMPRHKQVHCVYRKPRSVVHVLRHPRPQANVEIADPWLCSCTALQAPQSAKLSRATQLRLCASGGAGGSTGSGGRGGGGGGGSGSGGSSSNQPGGLMAFVAMYLAALEAHPVSASFARLTCPCHAYTSRSFHQAAIANVIRTKVLIYCDA